MKKLLSKFLISMLALWQFSSISQVYAAASVPTWTSAQQEQGKSSVYLNWNVATVSSDIIATEDFSQWSLDITKSNVIRKIGFGTDGYKYDTNGNLVAGQNTPHTNAFKAGYGYGQNSGYGLQWYQTIDNGWNFNANYITSYGPLDPTNYDLVGLFSTDLYNTKKDRNIIIKTLVKGQGKLTLGLSYRNDGGAYLYNKNITWAENLSASEFESRLKSLQKIKINNPGNITGTIRITLTNSERPSGSYNFDACEGSFQQENGQWYFVPNIFRDSYNMNVKPDQSVKLTVNDPITIGGRIYHTRYGAGTNSTTTINNSNFSEHSVNLPLNNSNPSNYYYIELAGETSSSINLDNLSIEYAPNTYVYRNNKLIHEGYTVEYTDKEKLDTAAPNSPTVATPTFNTSNGNVTLKWNAVTDNGTTHSYTLKSRNSNGDISALSAAKTVKVTSGIKGYKVYYNGTSKEVTATTITLTPAQYKDVRIVAVDKDGNESTNTFTYKLPTKPSITATMAQSAWVRSNSINYQFNSPTLISTKKVNTSALSNLTGSYPITKNGIYTFTATDAYSQNATAVKVTVTNIDAVNTALSATIK